MRSMNSLTHTAKVKTANTIKFLMDSSTDGNSILSLKHKSYFEGASQDDIPIKAIKDGICITRDGRYLSAIEILPVNFWIKPFAKQMQLLNAFGTLYTRHTCKWQIKIMSDISDGSELINNIQANCLNIDNPVMQESITEYIKHIRSLVSAGSVTRRYFYIWEYNNPEGTRTRDFEEIKQIMHENRNAIIEGLSAAENGNICLSHENESTFLLDFYYKFYNRRSSLNETAYDRYERLKSDFDAFNKLTGSNKQICTADLIAPKGLSFKNRYHHTMDGMFYTYIGISSDSWPGEDTPPTWLNAFYYGAMVDIDIIGKELSKELTSLSIEQYNNFTEALAKNNIKKGNDKRAARRISKLDNNRRVQDGLRSGQTLNDVCIVLTVRASTVKTLTSYVRQIKSDMKSRLHIEPVGSFLQQRKYFYLTSPFLITNDVFKRLSHDILSGDISSMYPFLTSSIYDPTGFLVGTTETNDLLSLSTFNTSNFNNANLFVVGTSGAGKTYTLKLFSHRMVMNGIRCFCIIPKKGYEYKDTCRISGGTFVSLVPGSKDCINIMEIRPESQIDKSKISEDTVVNSKSLLAKKINNIIMWIQLQMDRQLTLKEHNQLNIILTKIYADYGITEDNLSIFEDIEQRTVKKMPIIGDIYKQLANKPELSDLADVLLPYIYGNCKNMNQQTNIDLNNSYILFDIDEDNIGSHLLPAFLYVAFEFTYNEIKSNGHRKDCIIMDEIWKMLKDKGCAEQVQNTIKLIRGYNGGCILATQELKDLLGAMAEYGESILNLCDSTIVLKCKDSDLDRIRSRYRLTDKEYDDILTFKRGTGLLVNNGDKIKIRIIPSAYEDAAMADDTSHCA